MAVLTIKIGDIKALDNTDISKIIDHCIYLYMQIQIVVNTL